MTKKKNAFTLAEVLVTLAIIGVVAALTMPALTRSSIAAKIGPQLAKFVNTFETAAGTMMEEENYTSLRGLSNSNELLPKLAQYMIMSEGPANVQLTREDLSAELNLTTYILKDGTVMHYLPIAAGGNLIYPARDAYKGGIAYIYVNIAGVSTADSNVGHRPAKEVFEFVLDDAGILVPFGGRTHCNLIRGSLGNCNPSGTTRQKYVCTGAFADIKWKVPEQYK